VLLLLACTGDVSFDEELSLELNELTSDEMLTLSYDSDSDMVVSLSLAATA
jgi:hypothetical protein